MNLDNYRKRFRYSKMLIMANNCILIILTQSLSIKNEVKVRTEKQPNTAMKIIYYPLPFFPSKYQIPTEIKLKPFSQFSFHRNTNF